MWFVCTYMRALVCTHMHTHVCTRAWALPISSSGSRPDRPPHGQRARGPSSAPASAVSPCLPGRCSPRWPALLPSSASTVSADPPHRPGRGLRWRRECAPGSQTAVLHRHRSRGRGGEDAGSRTTCGLRCVASDVAVPVPCASRCGRRGVPAWAPLPRSGRGCGVRPWRPRSGPCPPRVGTGRPGSPGRGCWERGHVWAGLPVSCWWVALGGARRAGRLQGGASGGPRASHSAPFSSSPRPSRPHRERRGLWASSRPTCHGPQPPRLPKNLLVTATCVLSPHPPPRPSPSCLRPLAGSHARTPVLRPPVLFRTVFVPSF